MDPAALFITCPPGLEPLLEIELRGLGIGGLQRQAGGVEAQGSWPEVHRIQLFAGLASQVLWRIDSFGARSLEDLDKRGSRIEWSQWLPEGCNYRVKARCRRSRIYHSGAAEARVLKHLHEQCGAPRDPEAAEQQVRLRLEDNRCTISLDLSGAPLHRRGWRLSGGPAPLREDLAWALLLVSGWDGHAALIDPMCGTGTLAIEAAAMARGLGPGRLRSFACEDLPAHQPELLARLREEAQAGLQPEGGLAFRIHASDRSAEAIQACRDNAARAGVGGDLEVHNLPMSEALAQVRGQHRGALVCNPPYGSRLGDKQQLPKLYRSLGQACAQLPPGWTRSLMVADRRLGLKTGLELRTAFLVDSGGSKVRALTDAAAPPSASGAVDE